MRLKFIVLTPARRSRCNANGTRREDAVGPIMGKHDVIRKTGSA